MALRIINYEEITSFFSKIDGRFEESGVVYLIGETTQVVEGWKRFTDVIEFCSAVDALNREEFKRVVLDVAAEMRIRVVDEYPGEVVPLPEGHDARHRPLSSTGWTKGFRLNVLHFDPYSVSYRFIARGGENDYQLVLSYLENEWVEEQVLTDRLERLLPSFSFETIQQDPAEFRRRYGGLLQMWQARSRRVRERTVTG